MTVLARNEIYPHSYNEEKKQVIIYKWLYHKQETMLPPDPFSLTKIRFTRK